MKQWIKKCVVFFMAAILFMGAAAAPAGTRAVQAEGTGETASARSSAETVSLVMGEMIYYGSYCTHYYTVEGKTAYCLEPRKPWLTSGEYKAERLENGDLRKGLYYVYGGPGYQTYVERYGYLGFTGKLVRDDEYGMSHCIAAYLYSGDDESFTGLSGEQAASLKQKAERIKSMPEPPEYFNAFLFNTGGSGQVMGGTGEDLTGSVEIYKESGRPEWTDGNDCYSLAGAEFGLFRPGSETPSYRISTNADGYGRVDNVRIGVYEVRELKSPKGYALDQERADIAVREASVCRYTCHNPPRYYPAGLVLEKTDADTGKAQAQGSAVLSDAWFTVRFYPGYYDTDPAEKGIEAERTWILRSDEKGRVMLSEEAKVSGDAFYHSASGATVLPLGTVTFQETKAPRGYLLNSEVAVSRITETGAGETDTIFQAPKVPDKVIRGHIQIVKFREDTDPEEDQKTSLGGIRFTITSKTTGESVTIVTDENGYASTRQGGSQAERHGLVYDTYTVHEENTPDGLKPAEDFEVTIDEEGETLYYILENKQIFSPVKLVKKDSTTGKTVPVQGAQFELLDEDKKPMTMKQHYPAHMEYNIFSTDGSGSFILPEKLPAGVYYFREILPPGGYRLSENPVEFRITEGHNWDEPLEVEFENEPVKEKIHLSKTDASSGEGIEGVCFDILAKEDIVTPDGTVRLTAGETAGTLITDQEGKAESEELFPGKYELVEKKVPAGYMLPDEPYEVMVEDSSGEGVKVELENYRSEIRDTTAVWKESGGKCIRAGEETVIADEVELAYLNEGTEYMLKGVVKDAETGEPLVLDGRPVEAEIKFTPKQSETSVGMEFSAETGSLAGRRLVVCEYLYLGEELISSHDDRNDKGQTVEVLSKAEPAVKTGDRPAELKESVLLAAASAAAGISAAVAKALRNKKKNRRI